jgi:hypothetical protein
LPFDPSSFWCAILGHLPASFARCSISSERSLSSEPLWEAAMAFARTEVEHGVPGKDLLALAARSAEFDAADQLLNRGAKLQGLAFAPALLLWPDCGPESETDRPRDA